MKIGFIGLGKMGGAMVKRLLLGGHDIVAYDVNHTATNAAKKDGAVISQSIEYLVRSLTAPRIVWSMLPSGDTTREVIKNISLFMDNGDIIIDGGNSNYQDTIELASELDKKSIHLLDAGTSGGKWGHKLGYCIMIGGEKKIFKAAEPIFKSLACENGYAHLGPNGSGHFVKMIHNGIEYAMLQAYGEGFEILKAKGEFNFDLVKISNLWNNGSVIRSWLLELVGKVLGKDPHLSNIKGFIDDSGEGKWTVAEAIMKEVPAPVLTLSLLQRFVSRQDESFSAKMVAALRNEFGGHPIRK